MKISLIGTIDETHKEVSGQYDRTEIIINGLVERGYDIYFANMMNWQRKPFSILYKIIDNYFKCEVVIVIASLNGVRMNLNILNVLRKISKKPVFQIAVGGQSNCVFVRDEIKYRNLVSELDGIFVEIPDMVEKYNEVGINKVYHLPNCKTIDLHTQRTTPTMMKPYRFCTYSRVTPEKGIKEAIEAVENLNKQFGSNFCTLDVYGTYLPKDEQWFKELMENSSNAIAYKERIERKDSIKTLGQYDLMLFPTKHVGEGVPGGLIDCYEAGLPIIVCNTSFMSTIVFDGKSGFVYDGDNDENLTKAIIRYIEDLSINEKIEMRKRCVEIARSYDTSSVIDTLSQHLESVI